MKSKLRASQGMVDYFKKEQESILKESSQKTNIIDKWLEENGSPEIAKQVEEEVKELNFMTKEKLFEKYNIDETHKEWDNQIDNWISVEIFRIMHDGRLPSEEDTSLKYIVDFADKIRSVKGMIELRKRDDFGSLYLTSKKLIYKFYEEILKEIRL